MGENYTIVTITATSSSTFTTFSSYCTCMINNLLAFPRNFSSLNPLRHVDPGLENHYFCSLPPNFYIRLAEPTKKNRSSHSTVLKTRCRHTPRKEALDWSAKESIEPNSDTSLVGWQNPPIVVLSKSLSWLITVVPGL